MTLPEIALPSEEATVRLAQLVAPLLRAGDLLVLTGGLGAGKTYFAGALCHALGLDDDEPVTSPTFALVCEYDLSPVVLHADLYRLEDERDVFDLGLWERREGGALLLVEWGRSFVRELGGDAIEIEFSLEPRRARFPEHGARAAEFSGELGGSLAVERAAAGSPLFP